MRGRTGLWVRWAVRDARRRLGQVLSIALLLAFGVGMYAAMSSMSVWRVESADASFAASRMHDLRLSLVQGDTVREGALRHALDGSGARPQVTAAAERLVVPTQVDASTDGRTIIVPGRLVGAPVAGAVDALTARRGRLPSAPRSGGLPAVALEHNFARHYGLPPSGHVTFSGGVRASYTGQALAPEYFVVTAPGADFGAEAAFAVAFAPLRTVQAIAGRPGRVNELVLRLVPGADPAAVRDRLAAAVRRTLPGTGFTFTSRDEEPAHRLIYEDAEGDQRMLDVFAFLLLGAATFGALNLVSRTVEAQRREIGIGMALGVPPRTLARRPLLLSAQIGLAGVALGVPVGLAADAWLAGVMDEFFPLPVIRAGFQTGLYVRGAALGLLLPLAAAAVPVWRAVRVTPVEAIRVGARAGRSGGLAWLLTGVRLPGGTLANLPLRNIVRAPRRTATTLLAVGAVVAIVVALSGLMDSFGATLAASRDEALAGDPRRVTVDLTEPAPPGSAAVREVASARSVGSSQPSLRMASTLTAGGRRLDVLLETVPDARPIWHPTLRAGVLPERRAGLVLSEPAADTLRVGVGGTVTVVHPVPTPGGGFRLASTVLPVTGIHRSPLRFLAYTNAGGATLLHVGGLVNRLSVVPAAGLGEDDLKTELLRLPAVGAVQGAAATTDAVDRRMQQFDEILLVTVAIAAAMALLIAYNVAAINDDERAREHATMSAHGVPPGRIVRGAVAEATIVGILGTVAGIAAGRALLAWLVGTNLPETMPDIRVLADVAPATYALAVLTGTLAVGAAPLLTLRRLRRADVPSALRLVE